MKKVEHKAFNELLNWSKEKRQIALNYIERIYNVEVRIMMENRIKEAYARRRNNKAKHKRSV